MSYDISILVNGSRCKQYFHEGKTFVEAKDGSEYTIEIKNNTWRRVLAVCSVDGLDILNGKPAKTDNPGYVISGYNVGKFDGFRVSDNKVAKFIFSSKSNSYAANKGDGSEKNVGVIGIRVFEEKVQPPVYSSQYKAKLKSDPFDNYPTVWCDTAYSSAIQSNTLGNDEQLYGCDTLSFKKTRNIIPCAGIKTKSIQTSTTNNEPLRMFDMGTQWGEAKESKVINVEFERGPLAVSTEIYYASRESLIQMGVPIGNEKQVAFPESFVDSQYATPPKNWRG